MPTQAFVDESGGPGQGPVIVLVGLVGKSGDWAAFADRWRTGLNVHPPIKALHMREAAHLTGEFRGWAPEARDARVRLLAELVNDYQFVAISCAADVLAYAEIIASPKSKNRRSAWGKVARPLREPYFLCFNSMIMAVCYELMDQGISERFEIIFDEHLVLGPRVKRWYPIIRDYMEPEAQAIMPIEPIFRDDEESLPLQVSDLLAWLIRREMNGLDHTFDWIPEAMHGLTWSGHRQMFDRERLKGIRELSRQRPISDEDLRRYNRLLGLEMQ